MKDICITNIYSGIYKFVFPNGKIYIGLSNNMYRRILEHNTDFRNNLPIELAIKKYGKIKEFEILELIEPSNRQLMIEREKYWINYYNSTNKDIGYNISVGGDGANIGSLNHEARFTEEEIQSIYKELEESELSLTALAKKYGIQLSSLSQINNGITYYHSSITYPIRKDKRSNSGIKNHNSQISKEQLNAIYDALINCQNKSMKQLAKEFNISSTIIQNINSGKTYHNSLLRYPLRKPKTGARKLTNIQVQDIIKEIITNPNKSLAQIGREFSVSSKTVSGINCGTIYKQQNQKYPIR